MRDKEWVGGRVTRGTMGDNEWVGEEERHRERWEIMSGLGEEERHRERWEIMSGLGEEERHREIWEIMSGLGRRRGDNEWVGRGGETGDGR